MRRLEAQDDGGFGVIPAPPNCFPKKSAFGRSRATWNLYSKMQLHIILSLISGECRKIFISPEILPRFGFAGTVCDDIANSIKFLPLLSWSILE
jgi:hypothetical protein